MSGLIILVIIGIVIIYLLTPAMKCNAIHPFYRNCILRPRHVGKHINARGQRWG